MAPDNYEPVAADYPDCSKIVERLVKPEREGKTRKIGRGYWWQFERGRSELYEAISGMERVLVRSRIANLNSLAFVSKTIVFSEQTVIFALGSYGAFAILQSSVHTEWLNHHSSSMRTDVRYTPSDCFETFAFPDLISDLDEIASLYYMHRQSIMNATQEGMTKTYNRFHNPEQHASDIQKLRELHAEMDLFVAGAYGWTDLDLGHDFHETKYTMA